MKVKLEEIIEAMEFADMEWIQRHLFGDSFDVFSERGRVLKQASNLCTIYLGRRC